MAGEFSITSPTPGQIFNTATIVVKGMAKGVKTGPTEVVFSNFEVLFNGVLSTTTPVDDPDLGTWTLTAAVSVSSSSLNITARATKTTTTIVTDVSSSTVVSDSVTVHLDLIAPTVSIVAPAAAVAGQPASVPVHEAGDNLGVIVHAQDNVGVVAVEARIGNQNYSPLTQDVSNGSLWNSAIRILGFPLQTKLFVKARDRANNITYTSLDLIIRDITAPEPLILGPNQGKKIPWSAAQTVIDVNGTATDMQSGVASVICKLLDKAGNQVGSDENQQFPVPSGTPEPVTWRAIFPVTNPGWYSVQCEFRDHAGNLSARTIGNLEVAESFTPTDLNDLLGSRQYLQDLLKFFKDHFKKVEGVEINDITANDLRRVFHQEFAQLAQQTDAAAAQQPVNQVRLCIEVLRKFLNDNSRSDTVWVEDAFPGIVFGDEAWNWIEQGPSPVSGVKAHQSAIVVGAEHQHGFHQATAALFVAKGERLFAYVYLDPSNKPEQVMLQWNDGTWEHRAYWGDNKINWGTDNKDSRRYMGPLPAAGRWVRLEVPACVVGLEERPINGMAFTLYGGRATWDRAGKTSRQPQLVGHWMLDEGSGTAVSDSTESGNHGTLMGGANWALGRGRQVLSLDGVDDYVQVGTPSQLAMTAVMSISAWICPKGPGSKPTEGGIIVSKEGEYEIARFADGTIRWVFANTSLNWVNTGFVAPQDKWTHIVVTAEVIFSNFKYDHGLVTTYANGAKVHVHQGAGVFNRVPMIQNDFRIGGRQRFDQHFHGLMSDVQIYYGASSATEVYALNAEAHLEREYSQMAYETILRQLGTSYEELRLAHDPDPLKRQALALRLGIDRNPLWSDYLDMLLFEPQEITEAGLENLFGLVDSTQDPFKTRSSKQLLDWQLFQLHAMWVEQDHALVEPIIDPDVIGKADLIKTETSDLAFALWDARYRAIKTQFDTFKTNREQKATALAGLVKIVNDALSGIINDLVTPIDFAPCSTLRSTPLEFLRCLDTQQKNGTDIQPVLDALHLELPALRQLIGILRLAESTSATVTDAEWEGVYHILTRVWKGSQRIAWRAGETNLAIGPQSFKLYRGEPPHLPCTGAVDGALLANGVEDPNWILTVVPAGTPPTDKVYVTQQQPETWVPNNDRSHWISPSKNASAGNAAGIYVYKTKFDLSGWDLATVQIVATIAVDDTLLDVKLNGVSQGHTAFGFSAFTSIALSGAFNDGDNTVEFVVNNGGSTNNPTGLRVELSFASPPRRALLPRWRISENARREWQSTLRARIDQEDGLRQSFELAIKATEEVALPVLRDALIRIIAAAEGMPPTRAADWLSERLLIETQGGGWRLTTRVLQATETLQSLIFSLRTQRFAGNHPADSWSLPKGNSQYDTQEQFDEEWRWAGSNETWRAAMLVFYYPENILLPSLRERSERTPLFNNLVQALRAKSRITPETARQLAQEYLDNVRGFGKLAHWKCDESSGTILTDASGNGNHAEIIDGATFSTAGKYEGAIEFNGNNHAKVSHSGTLELGKNGADFSVSFWLKLSQGYTGAYRSIMHKGKDTFQRTFSLWMRPFDDKIHFRISTNQEWNSGGDSIAVLTINSWCHIAYVKMGSELRLYINGILDNKVALSGTVVANDGPLYLGKDPWHNGIQGSLDDVRIYNYALSDWAIANLFASGETVPEQLKPPFTLTNERTESELKELRNIAQAVLPGFSKNSPADLQEIFYFVPMALALQLQKSGEYTAALDWFQTVYAYNLPAEQRKIYPGLNAERNGTPILSRTEHWLREFLNPHTLAAARAYPADPAASRSNPYTRYTLMSLARCFLEFADAEFTSDTGESLARAHSLYLSARSLLAEPDFDQIQPKEEQETLLPNPVIEALRKRIENQLAKLHQGRNISGMKREIEIPTPPKTIVGLPTIGSGGQLVIPGARRRQKPTPYRFTVLMERSKQLVSIAQQIEAAYLAALEKRDSENYNLKRAGFDLQLAEAGNKLQDLREKEATDGETLVTTQKTKATKQKDTYKKWMDEGLNATESWLIASHTTAGIAKSASTALASTIAATQTAATAAVAAASVTLPPTAAAATAAAGFATAVAVQTGFKIAADKIAIAAETSAAILSIQASHERRFNDWQLGYDLAAIDEQIADQQAVIATDHKNIVVQEKVISQIQTTQATAMASYLANKFTSAELYEWMSGVLGGVYSYFLQQATGLAMLAESQLTFERQEAPTSFIQNDYWEAPSEGATANASKKANDRRGLTGSARLLQDIYQLDQFAFETNKRKLNLTHTLSLAALDPYAFAIFRETGVLSFNTPMRIFDEAFPGHYLRLIKRMRTSVVALIPPVQGIRATLMATGVSRVVIGGDVFQETTIRRDPELVALSSPVNATGVFELDAQSELLMPFESMGVDTGWEFVMPRASNPFDFGTIADVMVTIEYTAFFSDDYRRQVIQDFDPLVSADIAFSIRNDFPDIWYDLNNAEQGISVTDVSFRTERTHFPPNLYEDIKVQELLFAVLPKDDNTKITGDVSMSYTPDVPVGSQEVGGTAALMDRRIHTRLPAGRSAWGSIQGKRAMGKWKFSLPSGLVTQLRNDAIGDLLVVLTFSGTKPSWPM